MLVLPLAILLPGCIQYHKVVQSEFPQGKNHHDHRAIVHNHLRSVAIYRQFETMAKFDALWFSDYMRTCYANLYAARRGMRSEAYDAYLRRQLEENNHWITFYLLADIRDKAHISMSEKNTAWTLYLDADGEKIRPESIKEIESEMEPEVQGFFGHRFNFMKAAYIVKFPARNADGRRYDYTCERLKLHVSSSYKHDYMCWDIAEADKIKKVPRDEDFYWF